MIELIVAVTAALVISSACSLFEAVLYCVPVRHIENLVQKDSPSGRIFRDLRNNVDRPISAILTLNTIAHTVGAAFAGSAATVVFGYQYLAYFSILFTLAILIFSEVLPKTTGVVYAKPLVPTVAYSLKALVAIMSPVIWLITYVTRLIPRHKGEETVSPDEIKAMAHISLRTGGIEQYQEIVIDNILSLNTQTVKEVMTPRTVIFSLSEHLTLEEAAKQSVKWEHSRFPVYDRDIEDVVGIVLTRELFINLAREEKDKRLTELMRPVHFVVENAKLSDVLMDFMATKQHLFVVIDEYGGLSGVICLEDILEEILGREIMDESDQVADKRELARQRRSNLVSGRPGR